MSFLITKPTIGSFPSYEIDVEVIESIKHAQVVLTELRAIEEKFDFLIENYKDLQNEIFHVLVAENLYNREGVGFIYDQSRKVNIRLLNFLNSADVFFRHLKISGTRISREKGKTIEALIPTQEKESESFRLLNALRDHFQHYGIPTFTSAGGSWLGETGFDVLTHYLHLELDLEEFLADSRVRKVFNKSQFGTENRLELNGIIKEYLQVSSKIISDVRVLFDREFTDSKETIDSLLRRYIELYPQLGPEWQKILAVWDDTSRSFVVKFNRNSIELIERLRVQNSNHLNLRKRVISDLSTKDIESLNSGRRP